MLHRFTVVSVARPTIRVHCRSCRGLQRFVCAERLRANSHGKLVDVWLLYRCARCDATRNVTVVERTSVARIDRDLLDAAHDNDPATARRLARDVPLLHRAGVVVDTGDEWAIAGPTTAPDLAPGDRLVLDFEEPLLVRLDAVVAAAIGCSRKAARSTMAVVGGESGRLDTLRLWGTVEVGQLGQELVGAPAIAVAVHAREDHQLLDARPLDERLELAPHGGGPADDR